MSAQTRTHRGPVATLLRIAAAVAIAGCGGGDHKLVSLAQDCRSGSAQTGTVPGSAPQAAEQLEIPAVATGNTTRVCGTDPVADAAGVALAAYPSAAPGTHPAAVTIAPSDDWEAALASSVLMYSPIGAPVLLSGPKTLSPATGYALKTLAPTGSPAAGGAQVITIGDAPVPSGVKTTAITGSTPYVLTAAIDRFRTAAAGDRASADVVIASTSDPAYAMPAAGWAAESGDPILFVAKDSIPSATVQALQSHHSPHIYVLGPPSVISDALLKQLGHYGTVKRIGASDPAANSVAFAAYRDPPCPAEQGCVHVPGSFGWAIRSPGHGYTLLNASQPLDAAASAALSGSVDYAPQLLTDSPSTLPKSVLDYFAYLAKPGYNQEGPTAAVYNHGWIIGDPRAISVQVQAEVDNLLQVVPVPKQTSP
jgi:ell wall binding domain 2 (CWB2)